MLNALLARESALRGFAESGGEGFLQPYDEATAALAAAADRARSFAEDDDEKTATIADQERIAERWAGIANDAVIRIRNGRPVSAVSTASRNDLIERFEKANVPATAATACDRVRARRPRAAAERLRARPDRPVGQPGRARARQPPQPRGRRGPRRHRRAHRPAERAQPPREPRPHGGAGGAFESPPLGRALRPRPLQADQRRLRAREGRPGAGRGERRAQVGAPRERSRGPLRRRGVPDPAPGHAARGRRRPRGEAAQRGRARERPRRRPRDHGQLRRRLLPRGHAGRGHARADGRPRALRREGAWTELRRHVGRAAGRVVRARQPAPAWCRPARRATSARPGASRRPRGRRLPSRR